MRSNVPLATLWLWWLLTFVGFPVGGGLAYVATRALEGTARAAIGGLVAGAVIGIGQWLALRQALAVDAWWIIATSAGLAAGLGIGAAVVGAGTDARALVIRAVITGLLVGGLQWMVLRQHLTASGGWIVATAAAWAVGWLVTRAIGVDLSRGWTVFGASGAVVFAALTGLALVWLLRRQ